jgi:hypothetical protein
MRERGLDMLSVRSALAGANASGPSGFVMHPESTSGQRISIETGYFFESAKDVADVVVGVHAGKPIYLKEVAQIEEGAQQAQQYVSYMPGHGSDTASGSNNAELSGQMYPAVTITVTKKPGENAVPIDAKGQVSRNDWIAWAEGCWDDVHETDTLNTAAAKSDDDTRHICPLQLEVIRRCVLLYSNPGEIVFSPFAGIGSEGFVSLGGTSPKTKKAIYDTRRFYGCELKTEYYQQALKNLSLASRQHSAVHQTSLFAELEEAAT